MASRTRSFARALVFAPERSRRRRVTAPRQPMRARHGEQPAGHCDQGRQTPEHQRPPRDTHGRLLLGPQRTHLTVPQQRYRAAPSNCAALDGSPTNIATRAPTRVFHGRDAERGVGAWRRERRSHRHPVRRTDDRSRGDRGARSRRKARPVTRADLTWQTMHRKARRDRYPELAQRLPASIIAG